MTQDIVERLRETKETWRIIESTNGNYEVSNLGRVKSNHRERAKERILIPVQRYGYLSVGIKFDDGKRKMCSVHRLVLSAFIGPCPEEHESLHNNGDRHDNHLSNLRWGTRSENTKDKIEHGKFHQSMRLRRSLTSEQVNFIKENYKKVRQADLANMFSVNRATIQRIHSGERYYD